VYKELLEKALGSRVNNRWTVGGLFTGRSGREDESERN